MNEKILKLAKIYGKKPEEIIEELADRELRNGPPAGLGPRLMWIRGIQSMTRDELAEAAGISASSIGAYERGDQEPKAGAIIALAKVLKVSADFLLGLSGTDAVQIHETEADAAAASAARIEPTTGKEAEP